LRLVVVWVITIATFLGTVVAVLLMFFIFSRREQVRKARKERRGELRRPEQITVELDGLDVPVTREMALTENVSRHGARVVTKKRWQPNDRVLVGLPPSTQRSGAQIAYCQGSSGDAFAIGLQISSAADDWLQSTSGTSKYLASNPYRK
jgi:hypothetical protein